MSIGILTPFGNYASETRPMSEARPQESRPGGAPERSGEAGEAGDRAEISPRVRAKLIGVRALVATLRSATGEAEKALGGWGADGEELGAFLAELLGRHAEAVEPDETGLSPLDRLAAEFTPEKTAGRIFDFAVAHYGRWLDGREDTRENREAFVEFIGAAVEKGFGEAAGILGVLPEEVQGGIDRTHEIVFGKFADFVEKGLAMDEDEAASVLAGGRAFNAAFSPVAGDRDALLEEMLNRLGPDGVLRLDAPGAAPTNALDLVG